MSSEIETPSSQGEGMQFDHAEFEQEGPPTLACSACKREIEEEYFDINGTPVCATCRDGVEAHFRGGSGVARLLRAVILGGGAALIATIGYFSFMYFLNLDWSLISVLVGFFIGKSVRKGSGNRGGLAYQVLAVVLTYLSISVTYTAVAIAQHLAQGQHAPADPGAAEEAPGLDGAAGDADVARDDAKVIPDAEADGGKDDGKAEAPKETPDAGLARDVAKVEAPKAALAAGAPRPDQTKFDPVVLISLLALMGGMLIQIPILVAKESPITIAIVGFALWEAWKLNKRLRIAVSGPYRVGDLDDRAAEAGAHA